MLLNYWSSLCLHKGSMTWVPLLIMYARNIIHVPTCRHNTRSFRESQGNCPRIARQTISINTQTICTECMHLTLWWNIKFQKAANIPNRAVKSETPQSADDILCPIAYVVCGVMDGGSRCREIYPDADNVLTLPLAHTTRPSSSGR